jgi:hypothetical protein
MRNTPLLCLLYCFILAWPLAVSAKQQSSAEILDSLIACVEEGEVKATAALLEVDSEDAAKVQAAQSQVAIYTRGLGSVRSLQLLLQSSSLESVSQSLSRLSYNNQTLPSECADLQLELSRAIEREKQAKLGAFELELREFRDEVGVTLTNAEAPVDLDGLFLRLEDLNERAAQFRSSNSQLQTTTSNLTRIVSGWQDYLNYVAQGDQKQAESSLRNLNQSLTATPVVSRSKLLQMQNDLKRGVAVGKNTAGGAAVPAGPPCTVNSVTDAILRLKDLPGAEVQLEALLAFRETKNDARSQLTHVRELQSALKLINEGDSLLGLAAVSSSHYSGQTEWMNEPVLQIRRTALYHAIPEGYRPKDSEVAMEGLIAVSSEHMARDRDWPSLWEFLKVVEIAYSRNTSNTIPGLDDDIRAIEYYINAQRLEETGQLASAYTKYNSILSLTGKYGPYEVAQKALVRIRTDEADALFEDQTLLAETPRAPSSSLDPRSRYLSSRMRGDVSELVQDEQMKQLIEATVLEQLTVYKAKESVKKQTTPVVKPKQ